jgi:hypothetical protein
MDRFIAVIMLGGMAIGQMSVAGAQSGQIAGSQPELKSEAAPVDLPPLPPLPRGKSTIVGGEILNVDPVRDSLILRVFGKEKMKILFDERTQVYRDGKKTSLFELGRADHASVQTVSDGTSVYAISVHVLSHSPEGEYKGRVRSYNSDTRELTINSALSHEPFTLLVPLNTPIARVGQAALSSQASGTSDLVKGALISVKFESDSKGRGVVSQMSILATPGSAFVFSGNLSTLDVHSGTLVLIDPRDNESYQVFFDSSRLTISHDLHLGDHVVVTTTYDGDRYVANTITVD